ncbi:MAG: DUF4238 domain-containing protein [Alphaproteobacteria bacterium]
MNNQYTKKQHHFPQMMLKRFLNEKNNIFMFDKETNKISTPRTTETVAYENHLYSILDENNKDDSLEKQFSEIESENNNVIDRVLEKDINSSSDDLNSLLQFIPILFLRTPEKVKMAENKGQSEEMQKTIEKNANQNEENETFINNMKSKKGFIFASTFFHLAEDFFNKLVNNFDPCFLISSSGDFIVNDIYITVEPIGAIEKNATNFWDLNINIFFPLSSHICLRFSPKIDNISSSNISFSKENIDKETVLKINNSTSQHYQRYLYCGDRKELERCVTFNKI